MASNLAIARGAVPYVPPASLGFWRWTLVFLCLIPFFYKPIKKNFKYVGDSFVYEARSIHYSNKKGGKGIFGRAKIKDIKELKEEGIDTQVLPWFQDKEN